MVKKNTRKRRTGTIDRFAQMFLKAHISAILNIYDMYPEKFDCDRETLIKELQKVYSKSSLKTGQNL